MNWLSIADELSPSVRKGDTQACIDRISGIIRTLPKGPFHCVLNLSFTNDPKKVAEHFDHFLADQRGALDIAAVYAEMNAFDINPGCWQFDLFAYREYGGHDDYDWLSDWQWETFPSLTLTGMEDLQQVYGSDAFHDKAQCEARDFCSLLAPSHALPCAGAGRPRGLLLSSSRGGQELRREALLDQEPAPSSGEV